nr:casein kinase ii subunit beta-2 [Quercus suber]
MSHVKLYCAKCEDIYNPKSSRHNSIDGAYFGTSFHNILFQVYPALLPQKTQRRYEPRIYGFRVHASATLMRWQEERREGMKERLRSSAVETGFEEEDEGEEDIESEEDDIEEEQDGIDDMFEGRMQPVQSLVPTYFSFDCGLEFTARSYQSHPKCFLLEPPFNPQSACRFCSFERKLMGRFIIDRDHGQTNQHIASFLDSDQDLTSYRITCRSAHSAIDADNNSYWRRRFLSRFEKPGWDNPSNLILKHKYQSRRRLLRKGALFQTGDTNSEERCLIMLRELILDAFSEKATAHGLDRPAYVSINLTAVRQFAAQHGILRIVFKPHTSSQFSQDRRLRYRPAPLLALIQVLMAPDLLSLSPTTSIDVFSFPESQQWVYGTVKTHPLFRGCNDLNVDMEGVLHHINFWRYHMLRPEELTLHNALSALEQHECPRFWSGLLKQGKKQLGKHWKGSYAYLHRETMPDMRAGEGHNDNIQDSVNREGEEDAFQNMRLRFVPEGEERWSAAFEKHLNSLTPSANRAKTRAQHRSVESDLAACEKPQNFHFDGEGIDENDAFSAMGWLSSLPPQMGVPGWQRMTMMKYFTDQFGLVDMDALWAYEGVVLPGGQIMLGRWWAAEEETEEDDVYSGPFILWNVDGPAYPEDDDPNTGK